MPHNPFSACGKSLRSIYDPHTTGYWFSVIDLCAILNGSNHKAAQVYWKRGCRAKKKSTAAPQEVFEKIIK